jgi:hypothetical protein
MMSELNLPVDERWAIAVRELEARESFLERERRDEERTFSGLKNLDVELEIAKIKLKTALQIVEVLPVMRDSSLFHGLRSKAQEKAREATQVLEELLALNVSEDQRNLIKDSPEYRQAAELLKQLILQGGGVFFEFKEADKKKARLVASALTGALLKYVVPDDRYVQLFKTEELPPFLRALVNIFLPTIAPERQAEPPYGIEEGEQRIYRSDRMRMPLSQAILFMEEDLLPTLENALKENRGDTELQSQIVAVQNRLRQYRGLDFVPRSTPIVLEKDFYTEWISDYTIDGELLVTVDVPVQFRSGTNLDRIQELVRSEFARRLAGKGICPELDEEYEYLKDIRSGIHGSSLWPSLKLNGERAFQMLKKRYPSLRMLEDKRGFRRLLDIVSEKKRGRALKLITKTIFGGKYKWDLLP